MKKQGYVYIMTNESNRVLYTGVTSGLEHRVFEHKSLKIEGFTQKYKCTKLVYFEVYESMMEAIMREKQIKGLLRWKKEELIKSENLHWKDLSEEWKKF